MREMEFRAWHKAEKRMYHVAILCPDMHTAMLQIGDTLFSCSFEDADLMQYTGLKDKHGKEIFEGDIVKGELRKAYLMPHGSNPQIYPVEYEENMQLSPFHILVGYDGELWTDALVDGFEVIGNIHEHPKLIEAKA